MKCYSILFAALLAIFCLIGKAQHARNDHPRIKMETMREERQLEFIEKRHQERLEKINLLIFSTQEEKEKWIKTSEEYLEIERRTTKSRTKQMLQMYSANTKEEREAAMNARQARQHIDRAERDRSNDLREEFEVLFKPLEGREL